MEESYVDGVATHDDPESCIAAREGGGEAWDRGRCGPGIEPRNSCSRAPTLSCEAEGNTHRAASARPVRLCAVVDPETVGPTRTR